MHQSLAQKYTRQRRHSAQNSRYLKARTNWKNKTKSFSNARLGEICSCCLPPPMLPLVVCVLCATLTLCSNAAAATAKVEVLETLTNLQVHPLMPAIVSDLSPELTCTCTCTWT